MTEQERNMLRLIWCLAQSNGGKVNIDRAVLVNYPGDERAIVIESTDVATGMLVIEARVAEDKSLRARKGYGTVAADKPTM